MNRFFAFFRESLPWPLLELQIIIWHKVHSNVCGCLHEAEPVSTSWKASHICSPWKPEVKLWGLSRTHFFSFSCFCEDIHDAACLSERTKPTRTVFKHQCSLGAVLDCAKIYELLYFLAVCSCLEYMKWEREGKRGGWINNWTELQGKKMSRVFILSRF